MAGITKKRFDFVYSSEVLPSPSSKDEFIVTFYPFTPDRGCGEDPVKVTRNFEELIGFFEEVDEMEH